jgi:hypothetical protein
MTKKTPLQVEFDPGAFDHFEGTQQELDTLIASIRDAFANMTPEELAAQSRVVDWDELVEHDPEVAQRILDQEKRNLQ